MAQSKNEKKPKPQDSFADDLDSMLNLDGVAEQEVGMIDDDDAIDRLLIGDVFEPVEENDASQLNDIDQLIAGEVNQDNKLTPDFDEFGDDFDDLIADIQINPKQNKTSQAEQPAPFDDLPEKDIDQSALEAVGQIETFPEQVGDLPEIQIKADIGNDVLAGMAEIDEFSDESDQTAHGNADFLLADFDISVDDEFAPDTGAAPAGEYPGGIEQAKTDLAAAAELAVELVTEDAAPAEEPPVETGEAEIVDGGAETAGLAENEAFEAVGGAQHLQNTQSEVDYSVLIAGLTGQINELLKQHAYAMSELQLKSGKDELVSLENAVDTLQNEQKKAKRNIDNLTNKKPISAYVANGLAVMALVVGGSFGYQGYVAKSQLAQVVEYLGKIQTQLNEAPAADAAEKEMLRNQLDELSRANSMASEQIAELAKSMQGQGGTGKPGGDLGKQLTELSNQDMQMGAAIESLQSKIAALEKNKGTGPVVKPAPKTPPVVQENWVVNLVAFKQDWYAKRKAEEFAGKGVPAKVAKSESKGETWYRLSVDGFKSQYEAAAYAARVKKTLNLDSVWVGKNKN